MNFVEYANSLLNGGKSQKIAKKVGRKSSEICSSKIMEFFKSDF